MSMGRSAVCPYVSSKPNLNWGLDDPAGMGDEEFPDTMRRVEQKVLALRKMVIPMTGA
ncbi:MAG: hypothetical protein IKJ11_10770 [Clostridia bacterium]|nr:hypothetical protein [Clostridia bacterium]